MTGDGNGNFRPGGPIYVIELRNRDDGAEVAIVRVPKSATPRGAFEDVWTNRFANLEAARTVMGVMMARPDRWAVWARMASILGADFLTGLIEAEVVEASMVAVREAEEAREDAERRNRAVRDVRVVHVHLVLEGVPRIVASRGASRFMVMMLDSTIEARRVWDWVQWQTDSLQSWFLMAQTRGTAALEQFILDSMLTEEGKAKASGMSAGGRRPLRYWRPSGPPGRETPDGFDNNDGDGIGDDE